PSWPQVLAGFNCCCFAYGQTGSGKTYSMFGEGKGDTRGMIPRCMEEIFSRLEVRAADKESAVVVSFLEIYCDQIRDLGGAYTETARGQVGSDSQLHKTSDVYNHMQNMRQQSFAPRGIDASASAARGGGNGGNGSGGGLDGGGGGGGGGAGSGGADVWADYPYMNLEIHEDATGSVFVRDLSLIPVAGLGEVMALIAMGLRLRATHGTRMNEVSSRSHTVFTATVVQRDRRTGETCSAMLNLVDLAGSERLKKSASEGQRKSEALHINSSLTALGKVVMALDPTSNLGGHVPYRDSKLTRLLQNSLGGNAFTAVLATVHPVARFAEDGFGGFGGGGGGFGGGGGGFGGFGAFEVNLQVMQVLEEMGIATGAVMQEDGSIRLADGRIVGRPPDPGGGGGGGGGGMAGGGGNASIIALLAGLPPHLRAYVEGLQADRRGAKKKLQDLRVEADELRAALDESTAARHAAEQAWRQSAAELIAALAVADAGGAEARRAAAAAKRDQAAVLVAHGQRLLKEQRQRL
ncbi:unnamed protein product, partial [Phaeothamnion confervicola]